MIHNSLFWEEKYMLIDQRAYFFFFLPLSDEKWRRKESLLCGRSLQLNTEAQKSDSFWFILSSFLKMQFCSWLKCNILIMYVFIFLSYVNFNFNWHRIIVILWQWHINVDCCVLFWQVWHIEEVYFLFIFFFVFWIFCMNEATFFSFNFMCHCQVYHAKQSHLRTNKGFSIKYICALIKFAPFISCFLWTPISLEWKIEKVIVRKNLK